MIKLQRGQRAELQVDAVPGKVFQARVLEVASSVENLQPENVTVIDETGQILTAKGMTLPEIQAKIEQEVSTKKVLVVDDEPKTLLYMRSVLERNSY